MTHVGQERTLGLCRRLRTLFGISPRLLRPNALRRVGHDGHQAEPAIYGKALKNTLNPLFTTIVGMNTEITRAWGIAPEKDIQVATAATNAPPAATTPAAVVPK